MQRSQTPLTAIIRDSEGYYNLSNIDKDKRVMQRHVSHDELLRVFPNPGKFNDAYFCPFPLNKQQRLKINAIPTSLIVLDIDASDTTVQGIQATYQRVAELSKLVKLAALVFTGGGFHAYVVTHRPVRHEDRVALLDLVEKNLPGLIKDRGCTTDPVHLFRIPGSLNYKFDPPREVTLIAVNPNAVYQLPTTTSLAVQKVHMNPKVQSLYAAPPTDMDVVLEACAQLKYQKDHPNDIRYKPWLNMLTVANVCLRGTEWAHELSKGYSGYTKDEVDLKLSQLTGGPATCQTFDQDQPGLCQGCPHFGQVKSPAALRSRHLPQQQQTGANLPENYSNASGSLMYTDPNNGQQTMIAMVPVWVESWQRLPDHRESTAEEFTICSSVKTTTGTEIKSTRFRNYNLFQNHKLKDIALTLGASPADNKLFERFVVASCNHIRRTEAPLVVVESLGWQSDGSFCLPHAKVHTDGTLHSSAGYSDIIGKIFAGRGLGKSSDVSNLKLGFNIMEAGGYDHLYLQILLGLSAPLSKFIGESATPIVNFKGVSGLGKSLGLHLQESVWWRPSTSTIVGSNDTPNAIYKKAGVLQSLPIVIDEISDVDPNALKSLIYSLSDGAGRKRLDISGALSGDSTDLWMSIVSTAANVDMTDLIEEAKAQGQVFEALKVRCLDIPCTKHVAAQDSADLYRIFTDDAGGLGELFLKTVMQISNLDSILRNFYTVAMHELQKMTGLPNGNLRFRAKVLGLVAFTDQILRNRLHLSSPALFDRVRDLLKDEAKDASLAISNANQAALLEVADFINDNAHLIINPVGNGHGKMLRPSGSSLKVEALKGRLEGDALYICQKSFFNQLRRGGHKTSNVRQSLLEAGVLKNLRRDVKVIMAKDTQYQYIGTIQTRVLHLSVQALTQHLGFDPTTSSQSSTAAAAPASTVVPLFPQDD